MNSYKGGDASSKISIAKCFLYLILMLIPVFGWIVLFLWIVGDAHAHNKAVDNVSNNQSSPYEAKVSTLEIKIAEATDPAIKKNLNQLLSNTKKEHDALQKTQREREGKNDFVVKMVAMTIMSLFVIGTIITLIVVFTK